MKEYKVLRIKDKWVEKSTGIIRQIHQLKGYNQDGEFFLSTKGRGCCNWTYSYFIITHRPLINTLDLTDVF